VLFYSREVPGVVCAVQAGKAVVASQVLDQLVLILWRRLMLLELLDSPQVIAAQELKGRLQDIP
jgi:hypothetical protein